MLRKHAKSGAFLTAAALSAASAINVDASVIQLTAGGSGGGLTLNPSTVVYAIYGGSVSTTSYTIQGVTFAPAAGNTHISNTGLFASNNGDSIGATFPSETAAPTPDDTAMVNMMNGGIFYSGAVPYTATITTLAANTSYVVNLLYSLGGYNPRDFLPSLNGTAETNDYLTDGNYTSDAVYATTDTVLSNGSGQITIAINKTNGSSPFFNAVIVSTPEPTMLGVAGMSGAGVLLRRRRK